MQFCMLQHSLIFSFNLAHFGLKQNPTGLQEVIKRLDKNFETTLKIKSTLDRLFLMKKAQKKSFLEYCTFHQIQPTYNRYLSMLRKEVAGQEGGSINPYISVRAEDITQAGRR